MDATTAHWLALGAIAVCQGVTAWAVVSTRGKLAQLKASIPPDLSGDIAKLGEKTEDAHKRITRLDTAWKHAGEALVTAGRRLGAN